MKSPRISAALLFFAVLALGGCQSLGNLFGSDDTPPQIVAVEEAEPVEAAPAAPATLAPVVPETVPEREPQTAMIDDMDLLELGTDDIRHLFGEPDLVRSEERAELWLYRRAACSVHLVYYADDAVLVYGDDTVYVIGSLDEDDLRVRHVELRPAEEGHSLDETGCLQSLIREIPPGDSAG